jgi:hypothetical protein
LCRHANFIDVAAARSSQPCEVKIKQHHGVPAYKAIAGLQLRVRAWCCSWLLS